MNCKKIQELILTDYIDAQMGDKQKSLIDQHLDLCHDCKEYFRVVKEGVVHPFININCAVPNEQLWARIKQTIEEEQQQQVEKSFVPNFWERIRSAVHIPRPAFALATFLTMILMIGTTGQFMINSQIMKIKGQDQVEYLSSLIDEPVDLASNNGNDSQTAIEKYFL
jgi:predicted anti-sigma-YlaC factor YlaD